MRPREARRSASRSAVGRQDAAAPDVAIGPGTPWSSVALRRHSLEQAASRAAGGAFDAAVPLSVTGAGTGLIFAGAHVSRSTRRAPRPPSSKRVRPLATIQWSSKALGPSGSRRPVGGGEAAFLPQIAVSPAGAAVAVWQRSTDYSIQASAPAGGGFGAAATISATGTATRRRSRSAAPAMPSSPRDNATADSTIHLVTHPGGGAFTTPVPLRRRAGRRGGGRRRQRRRRGRDHVVAVDGTKSVVQSVTRPAGGTFGAVQNISNVSGPNSGAADKSAIARRRRERDGGLARQQRVLLPRQDRDARRRRLAHAAAGSGRQLPPPPSRGRHGGCAPADATPKSVAAVVKLRRRRSPSQRMAPSRRRASPARRRGRSSALRPCGSAPGRRSRC